MRARPANDPAESPYDTALDILEYLTRIAKVCRMDGWEVNVAVVSGPQEQITFSAQRSEPVGAGGQVPE